MTDRLLTAVALALMAGGHDHVSAVGDGTGSALVLKAPADPPADIPNEDVSDFDLPAAPEPPDRPVASASRGAVGESYGAARWIPRSLFRLRPSPAGLSGCRPRGGAYIREQSHPERKPVMAYSGSSDTSTAPPLDPGLRVSLSVMMFLEFAIWGAWFTVLGNRLAAMGLGEYVGRMYGTMALGSIFGPVIAGQLADRYVPAQRLLAVLHLAGAGLLFWMSQIPPAATPADAESTAWLFYAVALGYALVYSPTLALVNTVAFTHVPDGQRDFPGLRVWARSGGSSSG